MPSRQSAGGKASVVVSEGFRHPRSQRVPRLRRQAFFGFRRFVIRGDAGECGGERNAPGVTGRHLTPAPWAENPKKLVQALLQLAPRRGTAASCWWFRSLLQQGAHSAPVVSWIWRNASSASALYSAAYALCSVGAFCSAGAFFSAGTLRVREWSSYKR